MLYPTPNITQFNTGGNGRPALLPTPPGPYSPRMPIVTPPFSPYPASNNTLHYNHVAFFDNDPLPPHLIIPNVRSDKDSVTSQINTLPLKSLGSFSGKRFMSPNSPYGLNQQETSCFTSQSFVHNQQPILQSPVKTLQSPCSNVNSMFPVPSTRHQISSIFNTLHQQRRNNNTLHCKPPAQNHQQHCKPLAQNHQQRNNPATSSRRTSPMLSPKFNVKLPGRENKTMIEIPRQEAYVVDNLQNTAVIELRDFPQNNEIIVLSDSNEVEPNKTQSIAEAIVISDDEEEN